SPITEPSLPPTSTPSLHDALPICFTLANPTRLPRLHRNHPGSRHDSRSPAAHAGTCHPTSTPAPKRSRPHGYEYQDQDSPSPTPDRKSTRLNSSHVSISYAAFCLK